MVASTEALHKQDWDPLYDLVADNRKMGFDGKLKVTRNRFIADLQSTDNLRRLIEFTPVRTEAAELCLFDIYGCGELHYGKQKLERVARVRAAQGQHGQ